MVYHKLSFCAKISRYWNLLIYSIISYLASIWGSLTAFMPVSCHKYWYRKSLICHLIVLTIQHVWVAENHLFAHCYSREQTQTQCSGLCYAGPSDMCCLYSLSRLKSDFSFVDFWNILLCYLINNFIFASDFILILFESIYFGLRFVFNFYWPSYLSTYFVICLLCFTQR